MKTARPALALALCALVAAVGASQTLPRVCSLLLGGLQHAREKLPEARRRVFGVTYTSAVEGLCSRIPEDGEYLLVDRSGDRGHLVALRYDLGPRRCRYLGRMVDGRRLFTEPRPGPGPLLVVLGGSADAAPASLPVESFFARAPAPLPGRVDESIRAALDVPAEGETVKGELRVSGWCHDRRDAPCAVRVIVDGEERIPVAPGMDRIPRPGLEAAVPDLGPADRPGYAARYTPEPGDERGEHRVLVDFVTGDGRGRRLGPRVFRWTP